MFPYDDNNFPRWCLVTLPERPRMVIDKKHNRAEVDLVVEKAALSSDGLEYKVFFRTESLARWYRRKHDLRTYLVLGLNYENWLGMTDGEQIMVIEGIADDEVVAYLMSPE